MMPKSACTEFLIIKVHQNLLFNCLNDSKSCMYLINIFNLNKNKTDVTVFRHLKSTDVDTLTWPLIFTPLMKSVGICFDHVFKFGMQIFPVVSLSVESHGHGKGLPSSLRCSRGDPGFCNMSVIILCAVCRHRPVNIRLLQSICVYAEYTYSLYFSYNRLFVICIHYYTASQFKFSMDGKDTTCRSPALAGWYWLL